MKLIAPRSDFMTTMTPEEMQLMQAHGAYLQGFLEKGWAIAYGPVADPNGPFGMGVFQLPDEIDPQSIAQSDPTILSGTGFRYEILPMSRLVFQ